MSSFVLWFLFACGLWTVLAVVAYAAIDAAAERAERQRDRSES